MLTTAVVGGIADGARILVGAAASLGTSGTVVVPVASFVAVATLRRLASALQSTHLRLRDAAGMGTTYLSRALSTLAMKLCCSSLCCGQSLPMSDDFGVCFAELGIRRNTVLSIVLRQMAAT
jgi:hypothetical protein